MSICAMDEVESERYVRVYRGSERVLICTGEYGSMGDNRRTWNLEGDNKENLPPHLVALLNLIAPIEGTGLNGEDEEWLFTKDEWISMNAGCPELLELASYIRE